MAMAHRTHKALDRIDPFLLLSSYTLTPHKPSIRISGCDMTTRKTTYNDILSNISIDDDAHEPLGVETGLRVSFFSSDGLLATRRFIYVEPLIASLQSIGTALTVLKVAGIEFVSLRYKPEVSSNNSIFVVAQMIADAYTRSTRHSPTRTASCTDGFDRQISAKSNSLIPTCLRESAIPFEPSAPSCRQSQIPLHWEVSDEIAAMIWAVKPSSLARSFWRPCKPPQTPMISSHVLSQRQKAAISISSTASSRILTSPTLSSRLHSRSPRTRSYKRTGPPRLRTRSVTAFKHRSPS